MSNNDTPTLSTEQHIAALASDVLERPISASMLDVNLIDLGLDSLKLLFLIDRLESAFGITLIGDGLKLEDFASIHSITQLLRTTP